MNHEKVRAKFNSPTLLKVFHDVQGCWAFNLGVTIVPGFPGTRFFRSTDYAVAVEVALKIIKMTAMFLQKFEIGKFDSSQAAEDQMGPVKTSFSCTLVGTRSGASFLKLIL